MTGRAHIGTSGWVYKDWRGLFYPQDLPTANWFEFYARHFNTVEINNSFYRLPTPEAADGWDRQAPPGFVYALKLGQFGSHRKKLKDASSGWLDNHLDRVRRLESHLGPNLVQLPPRWKRDVARLDDFLAAAPKDIRWAVEMRDASWLHDDVFRVLERHGAALCIHDLLSGHPWIRTTDWTYVRYHGPNAVEQPYRGLYGSNGLRASAERLAAWLQEGSDVYAYFNNDYDGYAIEDAMSLRESLAAFEAVA